MTTLYQYVIRYFNVRRKKSYITITSPYFAFNDICSESMHETIRVVLSNANYKIDSYYVTTVLVDTIDGVNVLTQPETALPF
ncbi:hypothetical protein [Chicken microvirus mg8_45]|nr:hypothetical protein [Chicken microvirus mg8_45]